MAQPQERVASVERHEEVFLARYSALRAWAMRITGNAPDRADDLVQDAFVHFTLSRPDLSRVANLDGYLYSVLRNLNLSHLRRLQRLAARALPAVEYDSARACLRAADHADALRVREELRACCRYACARKGTSKMGSVLILRFLHGYYPREIALLLNCTREAVEERLRAARGEARQYLKDPSSLRFIGARRDARIEGAPSDACPPAATSSRTMADAAHAPDETLTELREMIFRARCGECFDEETLERLYGGARGRASADAAELAHAVSCPRCLDEINRRLNLAPLAERYPTDTLDKEARRKDDDDDTDGAGGPVTGAGAEEFLLRGRRRARETFEHRPHELSISVNGRLVAAQKIGAALSEQSLSLRAGEHVDFIEVFSEQEVRLLFFDLGVRADGDGERLAGVGLSDDRTLEARVSFDGPAPVVRVTYRDPLLAPQHAARAEALEDGARPHEVASLAEEITTTEGSITTATEATTEPRPSAGLRQLPLRLWRALTGRAAAGRGLVWRPASVSALLSLILIAALLFVRLHVPAVSAATLLRDSAGREAATAADPSRVTHRTLYLEERAAGQAQVVSRRRIEVWQGGPGGARARRVYDEKNDLVAGVWAGADRAGTIYRRGATPDARDVRGLDPAGLVAGGDVWLVDLSAADFSSLVGDASRVGVEESSYYYTLSFRAVSPEAALRSAALRLDKIDLRAAELTLVVAREGAAREYHFVESAREALPADKVSPEVFRPDAVLTTGARNAGDGTTPRDTASADATNAGARETAAGATREGAAAASAELEVEVLSLLNRAGADLGEQVSLTRTEGGALRVEALVESASRKEELLRALRPVADNPAVVVDVSTVEEALRRRAGAQGAAREVTREVEVQARRVPADDDLRRYFSARTGGGADVDEAVRRLAASATDHSRRALLHASAIKNLAVRFDADQLAALSPGARGKWLALIAGHARSYAREAAALRAELGPIFSPGGVAGVAPVVVGVDSLPRSAERLLRLSYGLDESVRSALTLSSEGGGGARLKSAQFWLSLREAEGLAAALQNVRG